MNKIVRNIHFSNKASAVLEIFKKRYKSQNAYVNRSVVWYASFQTTVVRIVNIQSDMAHFAVVPEHTLDDTEDLMLQVGKGVNLMSQDIRDIGLGNFRCEVIGAFRSEEEATPYCLYAMNKWMDEGKLVYNSEPFQDGGRFLVVPVDVEEIHPILEECIAKHMSFPEFMSGLVRKYSHSMDKIKDSLLDKRKKTNVKLKKEGLPPMPRRRRKK